MKSTNAVKRSADDGTSGSHAMSGVMAMRPAVKAFGRFTSWGDESCERFEDQLADGAQRLEHAVASHGDSFKIRRALDPFPGRDLLDQVLTSVERVRSDPLARRLGDLPSRVGRSLQFADRGSVWKVTLIVLDHERHLRQVVSVLGHVVVQVLHGLLIR